jgi:hypothetical protein
MDKDIIAKNEPLHKPMLCNKRYVLTSGAFLTPASGCSLSNPVFERHAFAIITQSIPRNYSKLKDWLCLHEVKDVINANN